jgi:hypothetical protein
MINPVVDNVLARCVDGATEALRLINFRRTRHRHVQMQACDGRYAIILPEMTGEMNQFPREIYFLMPIMAFACCLRLPLGPKLVQCNLRGLGGARL